jgi:hypothetical protein
VAQEGQAFVPETVTRAAASGALGVSTLDHEILDHPVKLQSIVKSTRGQIQVVGGGHRSFVRENGGVNIAFVGVKSDSDIFHEARSLNTNSIFGKQGICDR